MFGRSAIFGWLFSLSCFGFDFTAIEDNPEIAPRRGFFEVARLKQKLQENPQNHGLLIELGALLLRRNQNLEAEKYLELAARRGVNSAEFQSLKGNLAIQNGKFGIAEKAFQKAISLSKSGNAAYFAALSHLYFYTTEYDRGLRWAALGLKLHGDYAPLKTIASYHLIQLKRFEEAELTLMAARRLRPLEPTIPYNLACLYGHFRDKDAIIYNLRKAARNGYDKVHILELEPLFIPYRENGQFVLVAEEIKNNHLKQRNRRTLKYLRRTR